MDDKVEYLKIWAISFTGLCNYVANQSQTNALNSGQCMEIHYLTTTHFTNILHQPHS